MRAFVAALPIACVPALLAAQMTVTGRVTSGDAAVEGATVAITELRLTARSNANGEYSFVVRGADVRGQSATLVARHRRFGTQSVQIALLGNPIVHDFVFAREQTTSVPSGPAPTTAVRDRGLATMSRTVDSSALAESVGPLDIASALTGRVPGLLVTSAAIVGSPSPMVFRGPRSIGGEMHPLVVVDGIPLHNSSFASASQRFGLGGFAYGTPIADIALEDVASVSLLSGPAASARFGSRAANGVVLMTTKRGGGLPGFHITANTRFTLERPGRLPSFQNQYGQGLGGQFEFFDGAGGGINDAVDQSWGPKLDGQPIIQASQTEAQRPDVRPWLPHPSGVVDYFGGARTLDATVAVDGGYPTAGFRASLNARDAHGLTPGATFRNLGLTLSGTARPTDRLSAHAHVRAVGTRAEDRPGTGYDEINPVAGFTRMGRQVDLPPLRAKIRDTVSQINWIYAGARNNPFFQSVENSNDDHRGHVIATGLARYRIYDWLAGAVSAGIDNYHESRNFQVASGWRGGYPTALGRGDFSGGGSQRQMISGSERLADVSLDATSRRIRGLDAAGVAGVEIRRNTFQETVTLRDSTVGASAVRSSALESGSSSVTSLYAIGSLARAEYFHVNAGLRLEQGSPLPTRNNTTLFPSIAAAYDAAAKVATLRENLKLDAAWLRAGWWRASNEVTGRTLASTYVRRGSLTAPTVGVNLDTIAGAEQTTGIEVGAELIGLRGRIAMDINLYSERSDRLVVPILFPSGDSAAQTASITNRGYELQLRGAPFRNPAGFSWDFAVSLARNTNRVDQLAPGVDEVALAPSLWGASSIARVGQPLGLIVGTRYLRDPATQALLLENGLPLPDLAAGLTLFGSWQPDWTGSFRSSIRYRIGELAFLFDARRGGKIFSATNLWGSYAGTLSATLAGRDTGMVIAGVDRITGAANSARVSAEDYFHSLGSIHEAWIYDASYAKLREARLTYDLQLPFVPGLRDETARLSIIGRNLATWAKAPNIDPETALSSGVFQGFEMGQLPGTRSIGVAITITP